MCWYVYVYVCAAGGVIVKCQQTETNVTTCKRSLVRMGTFLSSKREHKYLLS